MGSEDKISTSLAPFGIVKNPDYRKPLTTQQRCVICGRWCYWNGTNWQCKKEFYDSYSGGWEHE